MPDECAQCTVKEPKKFVVPRKPRLPGRLLNGKESCLSPFQWAAGSVTTHMRGRYALYHGIKALGFRGEDEILVPDFHCMDIMAALEATGVRVVFYRVNEKIEGFFLTCQHKGLTGEQGVDRVVLTLRFDQLPLITQTAAVSTVTPLLVIRARVMVMAAGSPSGIAPTAKATEAMNISTKSCLRIKPITKVRVAMARMA